jgi:hypothetical protein
MDDHGRQQAQHSRSVPLPHLDDVLCSDRASSATAELKAFCGAAADDRRTVGDSIVNTLTLGGDPDPQGTVAPHCVIRAAPARQRTTDIRSATFDRLLVPQDR